MQSNVKHCSYNMCPVFLQNACFSHLTSEPWKRLRSSIRQLYLTCRKCSTGLYNYTVSLRLHIVQKMHCVQAQAYCAVAQSVCRDRHSGQMQMVAVPPKRLRCTAAESQESNEVTAEPAEHLFSYVLAATATQPKQYCVIAPHRLYPLGILLLARGATAD